MYIGRFALTWQKKALCWEPFIGVPLCQTSCPLRTIHLDKTFAKEIDSWLKKCERLYYLKYWFCIDNSNLINKLLMKILFPRFLWWVSMWQWFVYKQYSCLWWVYTLFLYHRFLLRWVSMWQWVVYKQYSCLWWVYRLHGLLRWNNFTMLYVNQE